MFLNNKYIVAPALAAALFGSPPAPATAQDARDAAIESYLAERGMDGPLAAHLRDRLSRTPASDRRPIAERLAVVYGAIIEHARDDESRRRAERHARDLLAALPDGASASLRLELDRARYTTAERDLERHRLLILDAEAHAAAVATMRELAPVFDSIARAAHERVLAIQRQEESGRPFDAATLARALREARRERSLGFYLAGWANTYLAEFTGERGRAAEALVQFGWLLGAPWNTPASLDTLPRGSIALEHVWRAAVGVGVAHAALGDFTSAHAWLDAAESAEGAPAALIAQAAPRRVTVLARSGRWDRVADVFARSRADDDDADRDATLARLVAALALGESSEDTDGARAEVARRAVAELVALGEIAHVVDLASRFGSASLAQRGFIGSYVRGLIAYEDARAAHRASGSDVSAPTGDARLAGGYSRAAAALEASLREPDAADHAGPRATAATLAGTAHYLASGVDARAAREAVRLLRDASNMHRDPSVAADSLWLALRSAERLDADASSSRTEELAREFLERFPDDRRAGVLRVRLAADGALDPRDALAVLLDTPSDSPAYETARRQAARMQYDIYRAAAADRRQWEALRYADLAEPLLALDRSRAAAGDAAASRLAVVRARRLLDALLSAPNPDAARAAAALASLDAVTALALTEPAPAGETLFRRVQVALASGDVRDAEALRSELISLASSDPEAARFAPFADRAMFDAAVRVWRDRGATGLRDDALASAARDVLARGAETLEHLGGSASTDPRALPVQAAIASAAAELWQATRDEDALELAYQRLRLVLRARPTDRDALRRLADVAEARGDVETSLSCWRTLSAGHAAGSAEWFEARVRLIELLETKDPDRAAETLRQHATLRPDLGPEPWRSRLIESAARLGVSLNIAGGAR